MNVTCPECTTTYRVDPAKVPAGGILALCARCPATFRVEVEERDLEATTAAATFMAPAEEEAVAEESIEKDAVTDEFVEVTIEEEATEASPLPHLADAAFEAVASSEEGPSEPAVDDFPVHVEVEAEDDRWGQERQDGTPTEEFGNGHDRDEEYAGASDVAFHAEETPLEDLPYLEPPPALSSDPAQGGDFPGTAAAHEESPSASTEEPPAEPTEEPLPAAPGAPGEMPLPPAPFGAASDPHRRAVRLARALVSDIVVYHPERRTRSLRQGTLRQEFREEIRKSWEEYANQVGSDFARQTTYFKDALNEILAEGATVF